MFPFGRRKARTEHPSPESDQSRREYVDLNMPLDQIVERGNFDRDTRQFRENLGHTAAEIEAHQQRLERALEANGMLLESFYTAANHFMLGDFFDKLRGSIVPSAEKLNDFADEHYSEYAYGSGEAFRAQATNLIILSTDHFSDRISEKRFPVWVIGARPLPAKRKVPPMAEYLAVGLDDQLPQSATNFTIMHTAHSRSLHRATQKGGALEKAHDDQSWNYWKDDRDRALGTAVYKATLTHPSTKSFGIVRFTAAAELQPIRLTAEDVLGFKRGKKNSYKLNPALFARKVDEHSVNSATDIECAILDDMTVESFSVMHHLTRIAHSYGLVDELNETLTATRDSRMQAKGYTEAKLRKTMSQ